MKQIIKLGILLMIFSGTAAGLLVKAYDITNPYIIKEREKAEQDALKIVFPNASLFEKKEKQDIMYYEAKDAGGNIAGYVLNIKASGYSGLILFMAGIDLNGDLTGIKILSNSETPGLGANITKPWFCDQFKDKHVDTIKVVKQKDDKNILAITGATISSRAITDNIKKTVQEFYEKGIF